MAQAIVTDLEVAEQWYSALLGGRPDTRPMEGLLEWHLTGTFGVQVWLDPARAGRSAMVIGVSEMDALAADLTASGLNQGGPEPGGGARVLVVTDPDGNQIVFTGD